MTLIAGPITWVPGYTRHLRHQHIEADDMTIAVCEYASVTRGIIKSTTSVYTRHNVAQRVVSVETHIGVLPFSYRR